MKMNIPKAKKMIIENNDNAKKRKKTQYLKTVDFMDESVQLLRKTDVHAETVVLTAQGRAEKIMKKV